VRPIRRPPARHRAPGAAGPERGIIDRGSLVLYRLTPRDATDINRRLRPLGTFVRAGDTHRAMVTRCPRRDGCLHLQVLVGHDRPIAVDAPLG
jgi:hypothetical protein